MPTDLSSLLVNKVTAIGLVIIGFLILASGYRYGSTASLVGGCIFLAVGIVLLILKIARRNSPDSAG